jgi:hypothetical protein
VKDLKEYDLSSMEVVIYGVLIVQGPEFNPQHYQKQTNKKNLTFKNLPLKCTI